MATLESLAAKIAMLEKLTGSINVRLEDAENIHDGLRRELDQLVDDVDTRLREVETWIREENMAAKSGSRSQRRESSSTQDEFPLQPPPPGHGPPNSDRGRHEEYVEDESEYMPENEEESDEDYSPPRKGRAPPAPPSGSNAGVDRVSEWLEQSVSNRGRKRGRASGSNSNPRRAPRQSRPRQNTDDQGTSDKTAKCNFCKKYSRRACEVCRTYVCQDHRWMTIQCPENNRALQQCFSGDRSVGRVQNSASVGRCVICSGGKSRRPSRTTCQTCNRFICAEHQVKCIRCPDHPLVVTEGRARSQRERESTDRSRSPAESEDFNYVDQILV